MPKRFIGFIIRSLCRKMARDDADTARGTSLPDGVVSYADLAYAPNAADDGHLLDVYVPVGKTNLPVLVDVHGGALVYGRKELNRRFCYALAKLGFVVVSVNYRLAPAAIFPEQVEDVTEAFRWVTAHAGEYGGRSEEIYLCGDSAGALLALYAAAVCGDRRVADAFGLAGAPFVPRGCFFVSGLYDMHYGAMIRVLRGYTFGAKYKKKAWYPYTVPRTLFETWTPPRCFVTTSRGDMLRKQTERFAALLRSCGLPCETDSAPRRATVDGETHEYEHIYPVKHPEWEECRILLDRAVKSLTS